MCVCKLFFLFALSFSWWFCVVLSAVWFGVIVWFGVVVGLAWLFGLEW